jgi:hypothetical protein
MDKRFAQLHPGMTRAQVIGIMKKQPDAEKVEGNTETLHWSAGSHYVKLRDGRVTEYGTD